MCQKPPFKMLTVYSFHPLPNQHFDLTQLRDDLLGSVMLVCDLWSSSS